MFDVIVFFINISILITADLILYTLILGILSNKEDNLNFFRDMVLFIIETFPV